MEDTLINVERQTGRRTDMLKLTAVLETFELHNKKNGKPQKASEDSNTSYRYRT
jgi:hypothetical protein